MPKTYATLDRINALSDEHLNKIFVHFFTDIVSASNVLKILDCFLLEGLPALFHFGLGFFSVYKKAIKSGEFKSASAFWDHVIAQRNLFIFEEMQDFAFERKVSFINKVFRASRFILKPSRIQSLLQEGQRNLGSEGSEPLCLPSNFPILANTDAIVRCSKLVSRDEAVMLVEALPSAARVGGFDLRYSTDTDGWGLDTLYRKCGVYFPCILLIKALHSDAVFGGFISAPLTPPSRTVRGDGKMLLQCEYIFGYNRVNHCHAGARDLFRISSEWPEGQGV